jgi:Fe-Mn family superoxide dismutase
MPQEIAPIAVRASLLNGLSEQMVVGQIIDTRPRHYSTRAHDIVEGAVWRDPERLEEWIGELSKDERFE